MLREPDCLSSFLKRWAPVTAAVNARQKHGRGTFKVLDGGTALRDLRVLVESDRALPEWHPRRSGRPKQ